MKNPGTFLCATTLILLTCISTLSAQDIKGGKITYEQIIDYHLEGAYDDPRWDNYIADLPKSGKSFHNLSFSLEQALYEEDLSKKAPMSDGLIIALKKANYGKTPKPEVKQTYYDFNKRERIEQIDFMTRSFLVESTFEEKAWKLTGKKKKVLDYVCMGAELELGEETITAWFTPKIPISAGPGPYYGLPGIILGLEKNDEVFLLATSTDFNTPKVGLPSQLNKGKKLYKKEFDQIVEEKLEEFRKVQAAKKNAAGRTKN